MPVPRPVHSSAGPPKRVAATAAAGVVLPIPISPSTSRSHVKPATAERPASKHRPKRSASIAGSRTMFPVGRPAPTSTVTSSAPTDACHGGGGRHAVAQRPQHHRRHRGRIGADAFGGDPVIADEYDDRGTLHGGFAGALPCRQPAAHLVQSRERTGGSQDLPGARGYGAPRRLVGRRRFPQKPRDLFIDRRHRGSPPRPARERGRVRRPRGARAPRRERRSRSPSPSDRGTTASRDASARSPSRPRS